MRKELKYSLRPLSYLILIKSNVNCLFRLKLGQNDKQFNGLEKDKYIFFNFSFWVKYTRVLKSWPMAMHRMLVLVFFVKLPAR